MRTMMSFAAVLAFAGCGAPAAKPTTPGPEPKPAAPSDPAPVAQGLPDGVQWRFTRSCGNGTIPTQPQTECVVDRTSSALAWRCTRTESAVTSDAGQGALSDAAEVANADAKVAAIDWTAAAAFASEETPIGAGSCSYRLEPAVAGQPVHAAKRTQPIESLELVARAFGLPEAQTR